MAIIGPADLPHVLKVESDPLKHRVLTAMGWPVVNVELDESQLEAIMRYAADWAATYLPIQSNFAYFYTQPLQGEYDLPDDAYWVESVDWDGIPGPRNAFFDVFGAEMFLFCAHTDVKILHKSGDLVKLDDWGDKDKIKTPLGNATPTLMKHEHDQYLVKVNYVSGNVICTPNTPIKTWPLDINNVIDGWKNAAELEPGDKLVTQYSNPEVTSVEIVDQGPTVSVASKWSCYYGCHEGEPVLLH